MNSWEHNKSKLVNLTRYIPELTPIMDHCPVFDTERTDIDPNDFLFVEERGYALLKIQSYNFPALSPPRSFEKKHFLRSPLTISALLVTKRYKKQRPCLLLSHGSGGNTASEWQVARKLMDKFDLNVLILDHYTQRNIRHTIQDQFQISIESQMIDLAEAQKFLEALSFINPQKTLVAGISRGGTVVDRLRRNRILKILGIKPFAAYICFYPLPHSQEIKPDMSDSPALYIVGEKDDITPLKVLKPYLNYLESHGIQSELHVAEGAFHAFEYPENGKLGLLNLFYKPTQNDLLNGIIHKLAELIFQPRGIVPMHKLQILKESCYIYDEKGYFPLDQNCSIPQKLDLKGPQKPFKDLVTYVQEQVTYGGRIKRSDQGTQKKAYEALYRFLETVLSN